MDDQTPAAQTAPSFTRIARATATIHLQTTNGTPIDLTINAGTTEEEIGALLHNVQAAGRMAIAAGYKPAPMPTASQAAPASQITAPQFCGLTCSPTTDDRGAPTWIIAPDGRQAQRREKQGDTWYSVKITDDEYEPILRIQKGERMPPIVWPAGQAAPQAPAAGR